MFKLGWKKDLPDIRDFTDSSTSIKSVLDLSPRLMMPSSKMPSSIDLRKYCSPIEDQGDLGSCTANAGVGLLEYYQRRTKRKFINGSRLFLYKTTRNLLGWKGDDGAYLRSTMQAMILFGIPPENVWPYRISKFDEEPTAFVYAYAQNFQALRYYRLDPIGIPPNKILENVKRKLAARLPSMFGFVVYSSLYESTNGDIPFPEITDSCEGGHALVAVGYDDSKIIKNCKGALLVRNSWGTSWGDKGYGWLPYDYVLSGLASDFWSLSSAEFVDTELFKE